MEAAENGVMDASAAVVAAGHVAAYRESVHTDIADEMRLRREGAGAWTAGELAESEATVDRLLDELTGCAELLDAVMP